MSKARQYRHAHAPKGYHYGDRVTVSGQPAYIIRSAEQLEGWYWIRYEAGGMDVVRYNDIRLRTKLDRG